ncbi:MAG: hypothetical protein GY774_04815 [Planctomycetes bacterium]|nr:hypothetical protein [Planctomycetota bacterium]
MKQLKPETKKKYKAAHFHARICKVELLGLSKKDDSIDLEVLVLKATVLCDEIEKHKKRLELGEPI